MTLYIVTSEWDLGLSVYDSKIGFGLSFAKVLSLAKKKFIEYEMDEKGYNFEDCIEEGLIQFTTEEI